MRIGRAGPLRRAPLVSVVEATDFWDCHDRPGGCSRNQSVIWSVFVEPEVRSSPVVVLDVGREDAPKMSLVDDDHVIETFASNRTDQAFDIWILPRGTRCRPPIGHAQSGDAAADDRVHKEPIAIVQEIAGRCVPRKASTICGAVHAAVGCAVTFQWKTRRLACDTMTRTDST